MVTLVGTNTVGNYSTPPLQIGLYTVEVQKAGFKTFSQTGIRLTGGQTWRQDVKLDVGSVTQSVEVSATAAQINTENPTVSHTISETYYRDMPAVMGADIRSGRIPAPVAARLCAHAAQRRCDLPRQPVHLAHQRRPDLGHRKLV